MRTLVFRYVGLSMYIGYVRPYVLAVFT